MSTTFPHKHFVYVLSCGDRSLYCGYTIDWKRRLEQHLKGKGAKYTKPYKRHPMYLVAVWEFPTASAAKKSEYAFKQLNRTKKCALVYSDLALLGGSRVKIEPEV